MDQSDEDYEDKLSKCSSVDLIKLGLLVIINLHVLVNAILVVRPVSQRTKLFIEVGIVNCYHSNHSDRHHQKDAILDDPMNSVTKLFAAATEENTVHNHIDELCTTKGASNNPDCLVETSGVRFYILHIF